MSNNKTAEIEPWIVRIILIVGGLFGAHRIYLKQIPEAFVFFSTFGVFLLGWLYDSFMFKYEVSAYNQLIRMNDANKEKEKWRNGKLQHAQSKFVGFSFTRFLYSVLYGSYIGLATWLACTVTFGWTDINLIAFICVVAMGIAAGVYMIGQCGGQSRDLSYCWISSFSSMFIMIRIAQTTVFRAIFFTAIISTVIGNRSARMKRRRHTWKHFLFWSSLFLMLLCVIVLGCSRMVSDKQVTATRPGKSRETTSVGSLLRDRIFEPKKVYSFFEGSPIIEYHLKSDKIDEKPTNNSKDSSFWYQIWSGELFDELTGAAHLTKIDWIELVTTFVVDVLRAEARVIDGSSTVEPFKWALWRNYLIHRFGMDTIVSDDLIRAECKKWLKQLKPKQGIEERDYSILAAKQGCSTV